MNDECEINDIREPKEFSGTTFSEFKKSEVKKELLKSLRESLIEPACYWCAELVCSGHYIDIWDIIITFYSKFVQLGHPEMCVYIEHRINTFREIARSGYAGNDLAMRNNERVRRLFSEIMCVLCDSPTRHPFEEVKIDQTYFVMTNITNKLKAPDVSYATETFKTDDPKELYIAVNELSYSVSSTGKNLMSACFWTEWIMSYKRICQSKKETCVCVRRDIVEVDEKHKRHVDWMVWNIFIHAANTHRNPRVKKLIHSLMNIYALKYSNGVFRKRRFLMYVAISLLVDKVTLGGELISTNTKEKIKSVASSIHTIYKQIKVRERTPSIDDTVANVKQSSLEKSIEKLDKLQEMMNKKFTV